MTPILLYFNYNKTILLYIKEKVGIIPGSITSTLLEL